MRTRSIAVAIATLVALTGLALGASGASAARLDVDTDSAMSLTSLSQCAAAMSSGNAVIATASASTKSIAVTSVPATCAGLELEVFAHDATGSVVASGSVTSASATQDIATGTYVPANLAAVLARIDGWVFPTTWTAPAPTTGCVGLDASGNPTGQACTLTITSVNSWTANGHTYVQVYFDAVTAAPVWQVTLDLSAVHSPSVTPAVVGTYNNVALASGYACSQLPLFVGVEANPGWGSASGSIYFSDDPTMGGGTQLCP